MDKTYEVRFKVNGRDESVRVEASSSVEAKRLGMSEMESRAGFGARIVHLGTHSR